MEMAGISGKTMIKVAAEMGTEKEDKKKRKPELSLFCGETRDRIQNPPALCFYIIPPPIPW